MIKRLGDTLLRGTQVRGMDGRLARTVGEDVHVDKSVGAGTAVWGREGREGREEM